VTIPTSARRVSIGWSRNFVLRRRDGQPELSSNTVTAGRCRCHPAPTLRRPSFRQPVAHPSVTDLTTLLERVGIRRHRSASASERATRIFPTEQATPLVPGEYRALYAYLNHRYASIVVLTFEQVEALIGFALPESASTDPAWWTDLVNARGHSAAWTGAGRTAAPNLLARTITFERPLDS